METLKLDISILAGLFYYIWHSIQKIIYYIFPEDIDNVDIDSHNSHPNKDDNTTPETEGQNIDTGTIGESSE